MKENYFSFILHMKSIYWGQWNTKQKTIICKEIRHHGQKKIKKFINRKCEKEKEKEAIVEARESKTNCKQKEQWNWLNGTTHKMKQNKAARIFFLEWIIISRISFLVSHFFFIS